MVRLDVVVQPVQLLVQHVEAEEAHFGNRHRAHSGFNLVAIRVGMAVGVMLLVLVRRMSILEWEKLSARHRSPENSLFTCALSLSGGANFTRETLRH